MLFPLTNTNNICLLAKWKEIFSCSCFTAVSVPFELDYCASFFADNKVTLCFSWSIFYFTKNILWLREAFAILIFKFISCKLTDGLVRLNFIDLAISIWGENHNLHILGWGKHSEVYFSKISISYLFWNQLGSSFVVVKPSLTVDLSLLRLEIYLNIEFDPKYQV